MAFIEVSLKELPVSANLGQSCLATRSVHPGPVVLGGSATQGGSANPTWQWIRLRFGGNFILILRKAVVHVPIFVDGGNRPLEL